MDKLKLDERRRVEQQIEALMRPTFSDPKATSRFVVRLCSGRALVRAIVTHLGHRQRKKRAICCVGIGCVLLLLAVGTAFFDRLASLRDAYTDPGKEVSSISSSP